MKKAKSVQAHSLSASGPPVVDRGDRGAEGWEKADRGRARPGPVPGPDHHFMSHLLSVMILNESPSHVV